MYNTGDKLRVPDYPDQTWIIEMRLIPQLQRSYINLTKIDNITVAMDYDTQQTHTLIMCHATSLGCIPAEKQIDTILHYLYCPMLVTCCPALVRNNYANLWPNVLYCGNWHNDTMVFMQDGILYVCSQVV